MKIITSALRTRDDVERVVRETVRHQLAREARIAERDKAVQVIADGHNKLIDGYGEKIEANMALLQQWADAHPEEFPKDSRSLLVEGHRLGYRLGQPHPKPMKRLTWKAIVERIQTMADEIREKFLRVKIEPNKEAMLAVAKVDAALLVQIGVEIVQAETFYLDPAREGQPEKRLTAEA